MSSPSSPPPPPPEANAPSAPASTSFNPEDVDLDIDFMEVFHNPQPRSSPNRKLSEPAAPAKAQVAAPQQKPSDVRRSTVFRPAERAAPKPDPEWVPVVEVAEEALAPAIGLKKNRAVLEKKSSDAMKPFANRLFRSGLNAADAADLAAERVVGGFHAGEGTAFGKLNPVDGANHVPSYAPNLLQHVINDACIHDPLTWMDHFGKVRSAIFWVLGCSIVGAIVWKFVTEVQRQKFITPEVVAAYMRPDAERQASIRQAFQAFLTAPDAAGKLPWVLEAERVKGRMQDYYGPRGEKDPAVTTFDVSLPMKAAGEWWFSLTLVSPSGTKSSVLCRETPTGGQIDWENFVSFGSMPWEKFCTSRPIEAQAIRVQMRPASHYSGKYTNEDYLAWEISHRKGPPVLFGYALRASRTGQLLAALSLDNAQWQASNLYLKWEKDSSTPNQVIIADIIRNNWLDTIKAGKPPAPASTPQKAEAAGSMLMQDTISPKPLEESSRPSILPSIK